MTSMAFALALLAAGPDEFPPRLPAGREVVTDSSAEMLRRPATLREGVAVAQAPPTVDFLYYPGQTYPGKPWSNWGDSLAVGGKYYASIGDHLAPAGNAFVFEYDPNRKRLRQLVDLRATLGLPAGHYVPGKIHSRLDRGSDGWLYFATHRGSTRATTDANHYRGDWIVRHHLASGQTEVVVQGPVAKHCIPASVLDPERLIFYGGTAPGSDAPEQSICFFAYDIARRKVLSTVPRGPARALIWSRSTGRVYYVAGGDEGPLMRYDPASGGDPVAIGPSVGLRAASQETPQGMVYFVSSGQGQREPLLYALDVRHEQLRTLGAAAVGSQTYIASLDADPSGRYLYYVPGAHGGSVTDGSAVVQFDVETGRQKVIALLHPFYADRYGAALQGTYSTAVDPDGERLYITWNVSRGGRSWDCCALTVLHIPASERPGR